MNVKELLACSTCNICGKKIGHTRMPLFWRVTVERFGVDLQAVRRQDGLAMFLGSSQLAEVMGDGRDFAKPMMDPVKLVLCEECALRKEIPVAVLGLEYEVKKPHTTEDV